MVVASHQHPTFIIYHHLHPTALSLNDQLYTPTTNPQPKPTPATPWGRTRALCGPSRNVPSPVKPPSEASRTRPGIRTSAMKPANIFWAGKPTHKNKYERRSEWSGNRAVHGFMWVYVGSLMLTFLIISRYTQTAGNLAHLLGGEGLEVPACSLACFACLGAQPPMPH